MKMKAEMRLLAAAVCLAAGARTTLAYVPEPQPAKSDVEITAIYYPGTEQMSEWDIIAATCPERKPLLGWFDEGNPEAIDWQIKWAVEHGITSFCVDWYWNKGYRRLEHWLKGYYRARYRGYLKWFMMYANHNQPGSHSTEDQVAVTEYWIENYFKTPEYYTIDGKPAVCIWDAEKLDRDFIDEAAAKGEKLKPGEGIKRAFAISERMVREAGLPGICWIDMWRTKKFDPAYAKRRVEQGYRAAIHYGIEHYSPSLSPEAMKPGETPNRFSYDAVVATAIEALAHHLGTARQTHSHECDFRTRMSILELKRLLKRVQVLGVEDCRKCGTVDGAVGLHRIFTHVASVWHLFCQHNDIQTHKNFYLLFDY